MNEKKINQEDTLIQTQRLILRRWKEEDCQRVQWWVLNWNESAIHFYKKLGAKAMDEWTVFRLEDDAINTLS